MRKTEFQNKAYWQQRRLLNGGFGHIHVVMTLCLRGPENRSSMSVKIESGDTEELIECSAPYWQAPHTAVPAILVAIEAALIEAMEYLEPF